MEIDFIQYLTEEEKQQIVRDEFSQYVRNQFEKDHERIFNNAAYSVIYAAVNEHFNGEMAAKIKEKAIEVIEGLSTYTVFKRKDAWDKDESKGFIALNQSIEELRPAIKDKLQSLIDSLDEGELNELLKDEAVYLLDKKLFGGNSPA